jgi:glycosyltransferase involved in cell wall biosynthesis
MPAHNAERTIELAIGSLLDQTWQNLQIIVVDDASTDGTLQIAKDMTKRDSRVEVLSSPVNVGPYVCRNLGVLHTRGQWLTVHDADDWAFPDRIAQQVNALTETKAPACTGRMLRMNEHGQITRPTTAVSIEDDGYLRFCYVSLMVQTAYFRKELGAWDSVRVGGDAEMIERITALCISTSHLSRPLMLCLDHDSSLTKHHEFGLVDETGHTQPLRANYKKAYTAWHKTSVPRKFFAFGKDRPFEAPESNLVAQRDIKKVFLTWTKNLDLINKTELFDADWYIKQYPEVTQTGLEPSEHYLVHGAAGLTDPSPGFSSRFYLASRAIKTNPLIHRLRGKDQVANSTRVLLAADEVAKTGEHYRAIALAKAHLSSDLAYTTHILEANASLAKGDEVGWQEHLNAYLSHFNIAPVILDLSEGTIFDRLNTATLPNVIDGTLVTVIMPAWNAEKTVRKAAQSILHQTWRNLELLIVDDASADGTWSILQDISDSDARVKIFRNKVNVGPYVSKNIALTQAKGEWITGHDADDWAHPQRLEQHLKYAQMGNHPVSIAYMLRITIDGKMEYFSQAGIFSLDSVARICSISTLFQADFLHSKLGFWDSVRYGADSEMIARAKKLLGNRFAEVPLISMFCLELPESLTNNPTNGIRTNTGLSPTRKSYRNSAETWHQNTPLDDLRLNFPHTPRRFVAPLEMEVDPTDCNFNYVSPFGENLSILPPHISNRNSCSVVGEDVEQLSSYLFQHTPNLVIPVEGKITGQRGREWAWRWGYWGRALGSLLLLTKEKCYLDLLDFMHDSFVACRDDQLGIIDTRRNKIMKSWGTIITGKYDKGLRTCEVETSGLMILPWIDLLASDTSGIVPYHVRNKWLKTVSDVITSHQEELAFHRESEGGGYFMSPWFEHKVEPLNHSHLFGAACALAFKVTGLEFYREIASKLYRFFHFNWRVEQDGMVSWAYNPTESDKKHGLFSTSYGDDKHRVLLGPELFYKAAVTIELPVAMYRAGILPNGSTDILLISRSIRESIFLDNDEINYYISNKKRHLSRQKAGMAMPVLRPHYMCGFELLGDVDIEVSNRLACVVKNRSDLFPKGWLTGPASVMAASKRLLRHSNK